MKEVRVSPGPQGLGDPPAPRGKQGRPGTCRGVAADTGHRSVGLTQPQEGGAGWMPPPNQEPCGAGSPTAPRSPQRRVESLELAARPQASHWAVFTYSLKYPFPYNLNQATGCYYKIMYAHGKHLSALEEQKMENRSPDVHRAKPAELKTGVEIHTTTRELDSQWGLLHDSGSSHQGCRRGQGWEGEGGSGGRGAIYTCG